MKTIYTFTLDNGLIYYTSDKNKERDEGDTCSTGDMFSDNCIELIQSGPGLMGTCDFETGLNILVNE